MDLHSLILILNELGRILGVAGLIGLIFTLLLSLRWHLIEKIFHGLPLVYRYHHLVGSLSFIMLLMHPLLLAYAAFLESPVSSYRSFFNLEDPLNLTGHLSLFTLILPMIATFFWRLSYNIWKWFHLFSGLSLVFGVGHVYFVFQTKGTVAALNYVLIGLLGVMVYFYKIIWERFFLKRFIYKVVQIEHLNFKTIAISMEPLEEKLTERLAFLPGQFVYVSFYPDPSLDQNLKNGKQVSSEFHPFTLSSPPQQDGIEIIIKALGDYTLKIQSMRPGSLVKIEGPYGEFFQTLKADTNDLQIGIAGGIGITPFLSCARAYKGGRFNIEFHYCIKSHEKDLFSKEMLEITKTTNGFQYFVHYDDQEGFFNLDKLANGTRKNLVAKETRVYICGPQAMQNNLRKEFLKKGLKRSQIHLEDFSFLPEKFPKSKRSSLMRSAVLVSLLTFALSAAFFYVGGVTREKGRESKGGKETKVIQIPQLKTFTLQEVTSHNKASDCWLIIHDKVYDITTYIDQHPTKPEILLRHCGKEATMAYKTKGKAKRQHSPYADQLLEKYQIGTLK